MERSEEIQKPNIERRVHREHGDHDAAELCRRGAGIGLGCCDLSSPRKIGTFQLIGKPRVKTVVGAREKKYAEREPWKQS